MDERVSQTAFADVAYDDAVLGGVGQARFCRRLDDRVTPRIAFGDGHGVQVRRKDPARESATSIPTLGAEIVAIWLGGGRFRSRNGGQQNLLFVALVV